MRTPVLAFISMVYVVAIGCAAQPEPSRQDEANSPEVSVATQEVTSCASVQVGGSCSNSCGCAAGNWCCEGSCWQQLFPGPILPGLACYGDCQCPSGMRCSQGPNSSTEGRCEAIPPPACPTGTRNCGDGNCVRPPANCP